VECRRGAAAAQGQTDACVKTINYAPRRLKTSMFGAVNATCFGHHRFRTRHVRKLRRWDS